MSSKAQTCRPWFALALAAALAVACSPDRPLQSLPEVDDLRAAPTGMTVGGVEIAFTAHVERDYMPGVGGEHGISVTATLRRVPTRASTPRRMPLPAGVSIDRVYVVRADRVWTTTVREPSRQPVGWLDASAREGPRWEPDQLVDVIVRVRVPDGPPVYLAVRGQRIFRAE